MPYITLANTNKIVINSNIKALKLKGEIYKIPIYFFSKYEKNSLLAIQELLKNPEKYFNEIYISYKAKDTFTFIYEGQQPSYHKIINCSRLNANYENYIIPQEIKEKGQDEILEFRRWFGTVKHLFLNNPDTFVMRLQSQWGIVTNPSAINRYNSGTTTIENITIEELENKIDTLIKEAGRFYYKAPKHKKILNRFSKDTYLAYRPHQLFNDTGYSDEEVISFLKQYDEEYKRPLKRLLIEYYRLKHNPDIKMEGYILERLGFRPCGHCYNKDYPSGTERSEPINESANIQIDNEKDEWSFF